MNTALRPCSTAWCAGRLVDDAAQAHIIAGVRHDGHVGLDILDLFAVVEALAAHDLVGDACTGKVAFDGGRLGVHAVEDGVVGQMSEMCIRDRRYG